MQTKQNTFHLASEHNCNIGKMQMVMGNNVRAPVTNDTLRCVLFRVKRNWYRILLATHGYPDSKVHGADMTQVGPMLAPWTLLSG